MKKAFLLLSILLLALPLHAQKKKKNNNNKKPKETPPLSKQTSGGHMRLITGYNLKDQLIYFSDSWGAGHEHKKMNLEDAFSATYGIYTLTPTIF